MFARPGCPAYLNVGQTRAPGIIAAPATTPVAESEESTPLPETVVPTPARAPDSDAKCGVSHLRSPLVWRQSGVCGVSATPGTVDYTGVCVGLRYSHACLGVFRRGQRGCGETGCWMVGVTGLAAHVPTRLRELVLRQYCQKGVCTPCRLHTRRSLTLGGRILL